MKLIRHDCGFYKPTFFSYVPSAGLTPSFLLTHLPTYHCRQCLPSTSLLTTLLLSLSVLSLSLSTWSDFILLFLLSRWLPVRHLLTTPTAAGTINGKKYYQLQSHYRSLNFGKPRRELPPTAVQPRGFVDKDDDTLERRSPTRPSFDPNKSWPSVIFIYL